MNVDQLIRGYINAWNRRDFSLFNDVLSPTVRYWDPLVKKDLALQEMGGYVQQLLAAFPDLRFDVKDVSVGVDFGVFEWVMRGKNSGISELHELCGKDLALSGVDVIRVEMGRIQSIRAYFDLDTYGEQLGLDVIATPRFL